MSDVDYNSSSRRRINDLNFEDEPPRQRTRSRSRQNGSILDTIFGWIYFAITVYAIYLGYKCGALNPMDNNYIPTNGERIIPVLTACCCGPCYLIYLGLFTDLWKVCFPQGNPIGNRLSRGLKGRTGP